MWWDRVIAITILSVKGLLISPGDVPGTTLVNAEQGHTQVERPYRHVGETRTTAVSSTGSVVTVSGSSVTTSVTSVSPRIER